MDIDEKYLKKALEFYGINNPDYINNVLDCLNFLKSNQKFYLKASDVAHTLYYGSDSETFKMGKLNNVELFFGPGCHPFITNIILLSGYKLHYENMKEHNLDEKQIDIHKKRVKAALTNDIYERHYEGIRISQMLWGTIFINLKIIEVGRLQYELVNYHPTTKIKGGSYIKIHIPKGDKLTFNKVKESLIKSESYIKKHFKLSSLEYYCNSWILSNQIYDIVPKASNIAKFHNMFEITEGEDCSNDLLNYVYNLLSCDDYNNLTENSSLQISIKKALLSGKIFNKGLGKLKVNFTDKNRMSK